jgi:hypothetical protein
MQLIKSLGLLAFAAATGVAASPATIVRNGVEIRADKKVCLCQSDVDELVENYRTMLTAWKPEYAGFIADDGFYDKSDSINKLAGVPTGAGIAIFPNKTAFVGYQSTTPDNIPVVIERKGPFNCNELSFIWTAKFTKFGVPAEKAQTVRGVTLLGATKKTGKWQIQSIDVEFNNINYGENTGGTWTPAPRPSS